MVLASVVEPRNNAAGVPTVMSHIERIALTCCTNYVRFGNQRLRGGSWYLIGVGKFANFPSQLCFSPLLEATGLEVYIYYN